MNINRSLLFIIAVSLCFALDSCGQFKKENTRLDIEQMLYGNWSGKLKGKNKVPWERDLKISFSADKQNLHFKNNDELDYSYRIVIHVNGDTILERRERSLEGLKKGWVYSKVHFIDKNTLTLKYLFKYSNRIYIEDKIYGFYLTRE